MLLSSCYTLKLIWAKFTQNRKRKRTQEPEDPPIRASAKPVRKRPRTSLASSVVADTFGQEATSGASNNKTNPIDYWREKGRWPREYFEQDGQAREDFRKDCEKDSWYEKYWVPEMNMNHLLAKKKSSSSLRSKQLEVSSIIPSSTTPSDQKPREAKSIPYTRPSYETVLATKGSFMGKSDLGIIDVSKMLCQNLLMARCFVKIYLRQNNQSLKILYFVMIYSTKLVRACEREMKLWLFEIFPY
jgi:hypothetical protein